MYYIYIYIYIYLYIAPPPIPCRLPRHGHCPVTVPSPHPSPSESIRVYSPSLSQTPPLPCGATAGPDPGSRHGRRPQPPVRLRAVPTRQSRVSRPGHGMACRLDCRAGRLPCLRPMPVAGPQRSPRLRCSAALETAAGFKFGGAGPSGGARAGSSHLRHGTAVAAGRRSQAARWAQITGRSTDVEPAWRSGEAVPDETTIGWGR